ncbi:MAG: carbonic anhydrase [Vicinamibacterales bacterium]
MHTHSRETQATLTPAKALAFLTEGNRRFVNNLRYNRDLLQQVNETSAGQWPFATVLSCIDSRTSAELIFDQGLGDIFSIRVAGNVLNEDVLGSMEFACAVAGSKLILVLGHTRCGAVKGACTGVSLGHLSGLLAKIQPSVDAIRSRFDDPSGLDGTALVEPAAEDNARRQMHGILERSDVLRGLYDSGRIGLAAAMYSVESGEVAVIDALIPGVGPEIAHDGMGETRVLAAGAEGRPRPRPVSAEAPQAVAAGRG